MNYQIDTTCPTPEEFIALRESVGWGRYDERSAAMGLNNSLFTMSLRESGKLIGFGRVIGDGRITFYIQDVIVIPEKRGLGYSRIIIEQIMTYLDEVAAPGAVIGLMAAHGVEDLYEKFGFVKRPNEFLGAGMTMPL